MPTPDRIRDAAAAREHETFVADAFYRRTESVDGWQERVRKLDDFMRGEWTVEFPDNRKVVDRPKIENRIRTGIEDTGRLAGELFPSMRVEPLRDSDVTKALKREQSLQYGHQLSKTHSKLQLWFMDMAATGVALIHVWPDFTVERAKRFPLFRRLDPRGLLPPVNYQVGDMVRDLMYVQYVKYRDLRTQFGVAANVLADRYRGDIDDTMEVKIVRYYGPDEIHYVAMMGEGSSSTTATIARWPNRLDGRLPLIMVPRPSPDGELRGQFDDMLPTLSAENRLMTYALDYADQGVYAPVIKRGMKGIDIKFGPGAVIDVPLEGDVGRVAPATVDPSVFRLGADLERQSRRSGFQPEARAGDIGQSIGSAAFVESLMGGLTTNIRGLQLQMSQALQEANEVYQLTDIAYCDERKSIAGYAQGGQFSLNYTPSKLFDPEQLGNLVTYGAGAGVDRFNRMIMLLRVQDSGWASKRWAAIESGMIDNYVREENRIMDEQAAQALFAGILAQANQGNLEPLARFQQARENNQDPLMAVADIVEAAGQPQQAQAQPNALPGESTPGQQEAAAQTGAPGGGTALPPLAALLGG